MAASRTPDLGYGERYQNTPGHSRDPAAFEALRLEANGHACPSLQLKRASGSRAPAPGDECQECSDWRHMILPTGSRTDQLASFTASPGHQGANRFRLRSLPNSFTGLRYNGYAHAVLHCRWTFDAVQQGHRTHHVYNLNSHQPCHVTHPITHSSQQLHLFFLIFLSPALIVDRFSLPSLYSTIKNLVFLLFFIIGGSTFAILRLPSSIADHCTEGAFSWN
ncbi:hypothetical protein B0J11DRAFT_111259 [Dendryphion nanum]|uniref:Uncharacterized protein n=1 Tax=Dendryphion nanum TaxID=256645 RepID=A0A9P9IBW6_9PLEO|nr:hypothetical protein B0J11DRAFT_111259 [Dendryphion nanum]